MSLENTILSRYIGSVCYAALRRAMKTLSWNCCGLGNSRGIHDLYYMVNEKRPDVVFLVESKTNAHRWKFL